MGVFDVVRLGRQTRALVKKNILLTIVRRPISFILYTYALPLAFLGLLLSIPSFIFTTNKTGIGSPLPIKNLADTMTKKLVIVKPPGLAPDILRVIDTVTAPLERKLVRMIDHESLLHQECIANNRGISECHAAISFVDSPETSTNQTESLIWNNGNHTWQYWIGADQTHDHQNFDAVGHRSDQESFYMPLQLAINNAITNSSVIPEAFMYTAQTKEGLEREHRTSSILLLTQTYIFALIFCHFPIICRLASYITTDRESGMSQLVDAMGGSCAIAARTLSWLIIFDLVCIPCFITFGILYWYIFFPTCSLALCIGWQILLGLAVNSSTTFAAAFFKKSRISPVYIVTCFFLISVGCHIYSLQTEPSPSVVGGYILAGLFPSASQVLFTQKLGLRELGQGKDGGFADIPEELSSMHSATYGLTQSAMLGLLVLNTVLYPMLACLVEKGLHGIELRKRRFNGHTVLPLGIVAEAFGLKKHFVPNIFERIFCCGSRKAVKAVDDISLQVNQGQILCLVGPNGSGKTTTLHMMSGFISPSQGSITFDLWPHEIGICPQRNTLWDHLTVREHLTIWSQIKNGQESSTELDKLIAACDLSKKCSSQAATLSGGQKRKLQLACMLVGNSSICLIDECTSGLDPLSRRTIWEILLEQRSKRSIVFTTHFLDEVDVLADQIVVLYKGKVQCQGAATELKNLYGGGYQVSVPRSAPRLEIPFPCFLHQDSLVYQVPGSACAAQVSSEFAAVGETAVAVIGPQFENVFLNIVNDTALHESKPIGSGIESTFTMTPAQVLSFWGQVRVLFRKRLTVLRRLWWPYFYVLALPILVTSCLRKLLDDYDLPSCHRLPPTFAFPTAPVLDFRASGTNGDGVALAPPSAESVLRDTVRRGVYSAQHVNDSVLKNRTSVLNDRSDWIEHIKHHPGNGPGGIYLGSGPDLPIVAFQMSKYNTEKASALLDLYSQMRSDLQIVSGYSYFAKDRPQPSTGGLPYIIFFTILQSLFPAIFVIYPSMEKVRKVTALERANGVRRKPRWLAYCLFDSLFILAGSAAVTAIMNTQFSSNGPISYVFLILALYGLTSILLGYIVSHLVVGILKSMLAMASISVVSFVIATSGFGLAATFAHTMQEGPVSGGVTYGLNLILPIGNVLRGLLLAFNTLQVGCKDDQLVAHGTFSAYGGPIFYLVLQIAILGLILWLMESDIVVFHRKPGPFRTEGSEKGCIIRSPEVTLETYRAECAESDLLRALHVTKSFGSNKALDDVTLGLPSSDVMALLGPNGAGKSTLVNLIQSELIPDQGRILVNGQDARSRSAQNCLGGKKLNANMYRIQANMVGVVCPQYDALDIMNTRDHLSFYARIKGIKDVKGNVNFIMDCLDLTPHASTLATKLSGGNKRKLSLAIALMGTPPVLVLDEPTSAMDAVAKRSFWKLIQKFSANRSILLTTHSMEEADTLATRAAIISNRILSVGTTKELRERYCNQHFISLLLATAPTSTLTEMELVRAWIDSVMPGAQLERTMLGGQIRFTVPGEDVHGALSVPAIIGILERSKMTMGIKYYSVGGATLESVFISVVRENQVIEEDNKAGKRPTWLRRVFLRS